MTTYELIALGGLDHGLELFYDEMPAYLVPPMLEGASEPPGDFVALYEALAMSQVRINSLENHIGHMRGEEGISSYLERVSETAAHRYLHNTREER